MADSVLDSGSSTEVSGDTPDETGGSPPQPQPSPINWSAVFKGVLRWGLAWGAGWAAFWLILMLVVWLFGTADDLTLDVLSPAALLSLMLNIEGKFPFLRALSFPLGGFLGGGLGGLAAGLITMFTLRRHAPRIGWKQVAPSILIWTIAGVLGAILSVLIIPAQEVPASFANCTGAGFGACLDLMIQSFLQTCGGAVMMVVFIFTVFIILANLVWFITGLLAGWLAVRRIRRLGLGIGKGQAAWVLLGWGLGGVVATLSTFWIILQFQSWLK